jgi:hypothetical protein
MRILSLIALVVPVFVLLVILQVVGLAVFEMAATEQMRDRMRRARVDCSHPLGYTLQGKCAICLKEKVE